MQNSGFNGQAPANPAATERLRRQHDKAFMQRQHAHPAQDYMNQLQKQGYYSSNSARVATHQHQQQQHHNPYRHSNEGFHNASSSSAKRKWQEIGQAPMPTNETAMQRRPSPVTTVTIANALDTTAFPNHPALTYGGNLPPPARIVAAASTAAPPSQQSTAKETLKTTEHATAKTKGSTAASTGETPKSGSVTVSSGLPTEVLGEGLKWPEGWTKIRKKRLGGASVGRYDSYWISPKTKFPLRSMNEVRKFLILLVRCGGDENLARREFKKTPMKAITQKEKQSTQTASKLPLKTPGSLLKPPTTSPVATAAAIVASRARNSPHLTLAEATAAAIVAATARNPPHLIPGAAALRASMMKNVKAKAAAIVAAKARNPPHLTPTAAALRASIMKATARNPPHLTPAAAALRASMMKNAEATAAAIVAAAARNPAHLTLAEATAAAIVAASARNPLHLTPATAALGASMMKNAAAGQAAAAATGTVTMETTTRPTAGAAASASTIATEANTATIENSQNSAQAATAGPVSAARRVGNAAQGDKGEATTTKNAPQSPSPHSSAQAKPSDAKATDKLNSRNHPNVPSALDEQKAFLHAQARHHALFGPAKNYKHKGPKPAPPPFLSKEMISSSTISMVSSDDIQFPHDHIVL